MKRLHRSSFPTSIRLISLALCYALVVTTAFLPLSPSVIVAGAKSNPAALSSSSRFMQSAGLFGAPGRLLAALITFLQGGGGLPSVPGPDLPDLDAARQMQPDELEALPPIASKQACEDCEPCPTCDPGEKNHAPVANAGGPYAGPATQAIAFNPLDSFDVDPGDGIIDYAWSFGDNTAVAHGATPTHSYQSSGNYTVSLTVTDHHSATTTGTTTASISAAPFASPSSSPIPSEDNGATFVSQSVPTNMIAGHRYAVSVTMRNTGGTTWTAAHLYRLGSQSPQDNSIWGRARIYLPTAVAPGADVTFNFTVVGPYSGADEPPPVPFQWRMVQDGVEWFGDYTTNQTISIGSNYQPPNGDAPHPGPLADLFNSRIAPQNRTGEPGVDLLSRNFNWGISALGLAGRSGLDLSLPLTYNSLSVWTKVVPPYLPLMPPQFQQPTSWTFDADRGSPSAGFRLGFPSIQGPFYNYQANTNSYLMITASGARVELRRIENTNVYEAVNSSYLQLLDGGNGSLLVRTTDGTQLAYWSINSEYRCTEIKDRNGNFITINYDPVNGTANLGRITSIVDTLSRTINFNYDDNSRLQTITQSLNGQTHVWASFGYSDLEVRTNFVDPGGSSAGTVVGLPENGVVSVLTQVGLDDGSHYNFDYTSWGQVYRITHNAADDHQLSYTSYDLPQDASESQTDCPRFTERRDWAESFNNGAEAVTSYTYNAEAITGDGTNWDALSWGQVTMPDGMKYREYATAGYDDWQRGLVTKTEIYSPGNSTTPKKTAITDWTQDRTNVGYQLNPRATASTISDSDGNRRRTTIEYTAFGLPSDVYEMGPYGASDWRILRRTHTDYNLSDAYINRRIIGLVAGQYLFAPDAPNSSSIQTLLAKTTLEYDVNAICSGPCYTSGPEAPSDPVVHHDNNYGAGFMVGRGLLAKVQRWDAFDEMNVAKVTTSSMVYNVYGSVIRSVDPLLHTTQIHYDDSFSNDGIGNNPAPM